MREEPFRRPIMAAILFGAGYATAQDLANGIPIGVSLIVSFVVWLNVAFD